MAALLEVTDLKTHFQTRDGVVRAVDGVSFSLGVGETLAIVGESGSGKSVTALSLMRLIPDPPGKIVDGRVMFREENVLEMSDEKVRSLRGDRIAMIFQDPMTSLNPVFRVGHQIAEALRLHKQMDRKPAEAKAVEMLELVGIPNAPSRARDYPHQFSGGMRQRAMIAMALACDPDILIADEPTTALDVTIQAQILDLIRALQSDFGFTTIYITHDLGVVANVADRVAVMYAGQIIEQGTVEELFYDPRHPYSWALLSSLPQLGIKHEALYAIKGTPPNLFNPVQGDAFAPRNPNALNIDFLLEPPDFSVSPTHTVRSWLLDGRAPRLEPPPAIKALKAKYERSEQ
ncbi:MAG TPA: peptide ABC transporter ATP-binding protein [Spirochaetaceae bacterium]|nr:peptide ABC transporter ATP-binding protein [Spirochaetaceae bacterium]